MAYMQPIRGIMEPIPINTFGGVYAADDKGFSLNDGMATDGYNMSYLNYPAMGIRPGYSLLGTAFGSKVQGVGSWKATEVHAIVNGAWQRFNGTSWVSVTGTSTGLSTSADPSWTNTQGNLSAMSLFMANGVDQLRYYDGTTVTTNTAAPAGANFITQHDNRMYAAVGNTVHYCGLRTPNNWTAVNDAGQIVAETETGENISGMVAGPKRLTIFKPNAIFDLFGTGPKEFTFVRSANDLGAINNKSILTVAGIIYFIHDTGVYSYIGSGRPRKDFSQAIYNYIKRINPSAKNKCSLGTDGTNLYVSIPLDNATEANTILEYNPDRGVWNVWKGYSPTMFVNINTDLYIANVDGSVRKVGGSTDNGAAITWKWVSKPFAEASITQRKIWYNLWTYSDFTPGSSMTASLSKDLTGDSNWYQIKNISATTGLQNSRTVVPTGNVANSNFLRLKLEGVGPVTTYEISRQLRKMPYK
ncbi:hypothetical protein [Paenibacillus oryzisoli]|uniref:Uncharacterized protein n=1 Tax=Paenibacillus oryzisoli TaxID=1850517 RepID=A0A198ADT0_9BACL|nr:hypothetical protein [Paenibacillus oryzisoli]OAS19245.1 hypothetical protein A8708_26400 [Paenibacillus oryzisoli]